MIAAWSKVSRSTLKGGPPAGLPENWGAARRVAALTRRLIYVMYHRQRWVAPSSKAGEVKNVKRAQRSDRRGGKPDPQEATARGACIGRSHSQGLVRVVCYSVPRGCRAVASRIRAVAPRRPPDATPTSVRTRGATAVMLDRGSSGGWPSGQPRSRSDGVQAGCAQRRAPRAQDGLGPARQTRQIRRRQDRLTSIQRSALMARIRGRDTRPELLLRSELHRLGFRFRTNVSDLPGRPDIVLPRYRTVVMVHGCFWHRHECKRGRSSPTTHSSFWRNKLRANRDRDAAVARALRHAGWRVVVAWECQLQRVALVAARIARMIRRGRP